LAGARRGQIFEKGRIPDLLELEPKSGTSVTEADTLASTATQAALSSMKCLTFLQFKRKPSTDIY